MRSREGKLCNDSGEDATIEPDNCAEATSHARAATRGWLSRRMALTAVFVIGAVALSVAAYPVFAHLASRGSGAAVNQPLAGTGQPIAPGVVQSEDSILERVVGSLLPADELPGERWPLRAVRMTVRLLLAALLAGLLAFRPHRRERMSQRNPYVVQTQILLAVVASALMMIVADNAARAFGIFAAASLVRFRTNIRDPKEITVLLINLAIGLATGVGRWELALILSLFVLVTLWVLEVYETRQVVRSMQLKVKTHNVTQTDEILRGLFEKHHLSAEVRELDREDEVNPLGRIVFHVSISPRISTDRLSEEIFSSDPQNVDTVEWHQKKSTSYVYR